MNPQTAIKPSVHALTPAAQAALPTSRVPATPSDQPVTIHAASGNNGMPRTIAACGDEGIQGPVDDVNCQACLRIVAPDTDPARVADIGARIDAKLAANAAQRRAEAHARRDSARAAAQLAPAARDRGPGGIAIGDRVTGRCVTLGSHYTGTVAAIHYPSGLGYYSSTPTGLPAYGNRYTLVDSGEHYSTGGPVEPIVECAERVDEHNTRRAPVAPTVVDYGPDTARRIAWAAQGMEYAMPEIPVCSG